MFGQIQRFKGKLSEMANLAFSASFKIDMEKELDLFLYQTRELDTRLSYGPCLAIVQYFSAIQRYIQAYSHGS
jgi:hypothetical protein